MRPSASLPLLLLVSLVTVPGLARAQEVRRALAEPKEARVALSKVKAEQLKADPALAECAPARHVSNAGGDWRCKVGALRLAAAAEKVDPDAPLAGNKGLKARAQLVHLALETADALGYFKPASDIPPELPQWQVAAQAEACQAAQDFFAVMREIPENKPVGHVLVDGLPKEVAPRLAGHSLKEVACTCHDRTQALGRAGFLSDRDPAMAGAQRASLGLACNLKTTGRESSLVAAQREQKDVDLSHVGGSARGADVDKDDAQRVADRRKAELKMCVDDKDRSATAAEKTARCACPLMQRWRFPKRETDAPLSIKVVVAEKQPPFTLEITSKGIVEKCSNQ